VFSHTAYNFPGLIAVCEKLARQAIVKAGGRIEKDAAGEETFVIPVLPPRPSPLELSWAPGPIAGSLFSEEEKARITVSSLPEGVKEAVEKVAPGWKVRDCGVEMSPGLRSEWRGKKDVLVTHPLDQQTGCTLSRKVSLPAGKKSALNLLVGHDPQGDWDLVVKADGKEVLRKPVSRATARDGWLEVAVDLSAEAGGSIELEIVNQPSGWAYEAGYWARIEVETEK